MGLIKESDYTIVPFKNDDPVSGVDVHDLWLITRYLYGRDQWIDPYAFLAADADGSGTITPLDLILLQKLILGDSPKFSNFRSWRFVPHTFVFPQGVSPLRVDYPEYLRFENLQKAEKRANFLGIKIGDVDASYSVAAASERSLGEVLVVQATDRELVAGQKYLIPISADRLEQVSSFQFTLRLNTRAADLVEVAPAYLSEQNFGTHLQKEGLLPAIWYQKEEHTKFPASQKGEKTVLFNLIIEAKQSGPLRDILALGSFYTPVRAYASDGEPRQVTLEFSGTEGTVRDFELFQNIPNPFQDQTVIGFFLPEASPVKLIVRDLSGRVVETINGDFNAGYGELEVNLGQGKGLYLYTLETNRHTATGKMVKTQ